VSIKAVQDPRLAGGAYAPSARRRLAWSLGRWEDLVIAVEYDDLLLAFEFVSSSPPMENSAYVSLDTGKIYWISSLNPIEDDAPDDLEESDRYLAVPHKNDLDLGQDLVFRFVAQELPNDYERVRGFFRHKGAYGRFKQLLESEGILEKWYKFENASMDMALREWCVQNDVQLHERNDKPAA
jgi:hypothetical protein